MSSHAQPIKIRLSEMRVTSAPRSGDQFVYITYDNRAYVCWYQGLIAGHILNAALYGDTLILVTVYGDILVALPDPKLAVAMVGQVYEIAICQRTIHVLDRDGTTRTMCPIPTNMSEQEASQCVAIIEYHDDAVVKIVPRSQVTQVQ